MTRNAVTVSSRII